MNIRILYFLAFSMSSLLAFLLPIIPIYALYLGASQFMLGLIGAVGAFSYAFFCLFLGRVRRFLGCVSVAFSFAGFGVFCCLFPLAASSEPIPLLMLLQGLSTSFFWPSVEVLVKDASKKSRVGDSSSNYSFSWSAGAVAGSLASGFALEFNKLQLVFVFVSIVSFALAAVSAYTIRGDRVYDSFGPDSISGLNARHIFWSLSGFGFQFSFTPLFRV
jgi:MFS family permease